MSPTKILQVPQKAKSTHFRSPTKSKQAASCLQETFGPCVSRTKKFSNGDLQEYTNIYFSSASRIQFLGV